MEKRIGKPKTIVAIARNLPEGISATEYTRHQLNRLGIGEEIDCIY